MMLEISGGKSPHDIMANHELDLEVPTWMVFCHKNYLWLKHFPKTIRWVNKNANMAKKLNLWRKLINGKSGPPP